MTDSPENVWDNPESDHDHETDAAQATDVTPDEGDQAIGEQEEQPTTRRELRIIEGLRTEVADLREELATAQADLANHRTRKRKDLDDQYEAGRGEVITNLVPVLDNISGAKEHGDLADDNPLTPVVKSLAHILEGLGLGAIGTVGDDFDPRVHEALHVEYVPEAEGTKISKVHQSGYATSERLLRPALVTVAKKG